MEYSMMEISTIIKPKGHKVINELSQSDYFGEVSLLTNLPPTASINVISKAICYKLKRASFLQFLDNFKDCKTKIMEHIHSYQDIYFKRLHKIIKQVHFFNYLPFKTNRNLIFLWKQVKYNEGSIIVHFKEQISKMFIIIQGSVELHNAHFHNSNQPSLFQWLPTGSWFNLINCIMGHYTLFEIKAGKDWILMSLTEEDLSNLWRKEVDLKDIIDDIKLKFTPRGSKYDYDYFNLNIKPTVSSKNITSFRKGKSPKHSFKRTSNIPSSLSKWKKMMLLFLPQYSKKNMKWINLITPPIPETVKLRIHIITNYSVSFKF